MFEQIDLNRLRDDEEYAADIARTTGDPATGLMLMSVWRNSALVLTGIITNERLSAGARTRAAEMIASPLTGDAQ